ELPPARAPVLGRLHPPGGPQRPPAGLRRLLQLHLRPPGSGGAGGGGRPEALGPGALQGAVRGSRRPLLRLRGPPDDLLGDRAGLQRRAPRRGAGPASRRLIGQRFRIGPKSSGESRSASAILVKPLNICVTWSASRIPASDSPSRRTWWRWKSTP